MDGLLIDSEDIYSECTNIILHEYGKPSLPWKIKAQLQGRPGPEVHAHSSKPPSTQIAAYITNTLQSAAIFHAWAQLPLSPTAFHTRLSALQRQKFPSTRPLPGVPTLLPTLAASPSHIHLALATSSNATNYSVKTAHLQPLFAHFPPSQRVLGDDARIPTGRGKPAPDIYLLALRTINEGIRARGGGEREVRVEECLVFEDSVPGVEAGRRAGMRVVWCPHAGLWEEYRGKEKEVLAGVTGQHVDGEVEETLEDAGAAGRVKGRPGKIDDGWGQFLQTLEEFPYEKYGIEVSQPN